MKCPPKDTATDSEAMRHADLGRVIRQHVDSLNEEIEDVNILHHISNLLLFEGAVGLIEILS